MVFEEFNGKIPLENMLKYLDPYPLALEVKGGTEPAMYKLVIITSNTHPLDWYTRADEYRVNPNDPLAETSAKKRRTDALAALWDRLGYKPISRTCGECLFYDLSESCGIPIMDQIQTIRTEIMEKLSLVKRQLFGDEEHQEDPRNPISDTEVMDDKDSTGALDELVEAANATSDDEDKHPYLPDLPSAQDPNATWEHEEISSAEDISTEEDI